MYSVCNPRPNTTVPQTIQFLKPRIKNRIRCTYISGNNVNNKNPELASIFNTNTDPVSVPIGAPYIPIAPWLQKISRQTKITYTKHTPIMHKLMHIQDVTVAYSS